MKLSDNQDHYRVRQSWINDFMVCPERSRLALTLPHFRSGSDATAIGTGIHSAIEWAMGEHSHPSLVDMDDLKDKATTFVGEELAKPIKTSKISEDEHKMWATVDAMVEAWLIDIAPLVEWGGQSEFQFEVDTGLLTLDNKPILFTGTMDYISPKGEIWDWKTAGRAYTQADKQLRSIQSSVYCYAAQRLGLAQPDDGKHVFRYGVMLRQQKPRGQVVEVVRDGSHFNWLLAQVKAASFMASAVGQSQQWPMNDQGHLCSPQWCDYWSVCKGGYVA